MTNHVDVLVTPGEGEPISATVQALGKRFVPYTNYRYAQRGGVRS
jgi:hypothetical protein